MKKSAIWIPTVLCLGILLLVPSCHCASIIRQTCLRLHTSESNKNLCVSSLTPAFGSSSADVKGLALIMFKNVLLIKVSVTQRKIYEAPGNSLPPLQSCKDKYTKIAEHMTKATSEILGESYSSAAITVQQIIPLSKECARGNIPTNIKDMCQQVSNEAEVSSGLLRLV